MELKILTAQEAHDKSQTSIDKMRNVYITKIFEEGIYPAITQGNFKCTVSCQNIFPEYILNYIRQLGYRCSYGKKYDCRNETYDDEHILNISW